jgi:outer membrane receptor for ferrienterochelin and colicin
MAFLLGALINNPAFAQERRVTGNVTSAEDNNALPGVSVVAKGSSRGTQTDANGNYSLELPANATTLVFSFVGVATQEVAVRNQNVVNVAMSNDSRSLNEVVVVGYGTQQRRDVTGSAATINSSEIANLPVTTFESALQGRAAGVQVTQSSGKLGTALQIRVRGAASVSAGNEPLYVLDGIPITSVDAGSSTTETYSPLADIDPNDIERLVF